MGVYKKPKYAVIFIGIPASGKSTFYRERYSDYVHINLDTLHTRNKENILLDDCFRKGLSFVVDNTNPTVEDRAKYISTAKDKGYHIIGYYFRSSVFESLERNNLREVMMELLLYLCIWLLLYDFCMKSINRNIK